MKIEITREAQEILEEVIEHSDHLADGQWSQAIETLSASFEDMVAAYLFFRNK